MYNKKLRSWEGLCNIIMKQPRKRTKKEAYVVTPDGSQYYIDVKFDNKSNIYLTTNGEVEELNELGERKRTMPTWCDMDNLWVANTYEGNDPGKHFIIVLGYDEDAARKNAKQYYKDNIKESYYKIAITSYSDFEENYGLANFDFDCSHVVNY